MLSLAAPGASRDGPGTHGLSTLPRQFNRTTGTARTCKPKHLGSGRTRPPQTWRRFHGTVISKIRKRMKRSQVREMDPLSMTPPRFSCATCGRTGTVCGFSKLSSA